MPISNNKIVAFQKLIANLPDKPNTLYTAQQLKAYFYSSPEELRVKLNALIDNLLSTASGDSGADNIKATPISGVGDASTDTVQKILVALKALDDSNKAYLLSQIQSVVLGQIPDGTITDVKLSNASTDIKQRFQAHVDNTTPHSQYVPQLGANNQTVNFFNALNQQIDTRSVAFSYDASGNLTTVTEKDGATTVKTTTLAYSSGQLSTVTEQVGDKTITITLGYDTNGNLISVTRSVV